MSSPGIVMVGKFVRPGSGAFQSYIDYLDRENAVRNEAYESYSAFTSTEGTSGLYEGESEETLDGYIKYMANPVKTSNIFTLETNSLDEKDIAELKNEFITAASNGSPMWQDVFSFRNDWLIEHGFLDPKTNQLDESKLQLATRLGMNAMLKKEDMLHSTIWSASIHYNTDNIHVHVATVEPEPTREFHTFLDKESGKEVSERKGYRSRKSLRAMKSAFANQLLGLEAERTRIDQIKKEMIEGMRSTSGAATLTKNDQLLRAIVEKLPPQKGYQKYGYSEKFGFKEPLDQMINLFLKDNYSELLEEIQERQQFISFEEESAFGEGRNSSENKMETLYTRLGNSVLKHIKDLDIQPQKTQHAGLDPNELENIEERFKEVNTTNNRIENTFSKKQVSKAEIRFDPSKFEDALRLISDHGETDKERPTDEDIDRYFQSVREKKRQQLNPDKGTEKQLVPLKKDQEKEAEALDRALKKLVPGERSGHDLTSRSTNGLYEDVDTFFLEDYEQTAGAIDEYNRLFSTQHETVRKSFDQRKDRVKKEFSNMYQVKFGQVKQRRNPKMSVKEMEQRQKSWQQEIERRQQLNQLNRLLKDNTQQWLNERQYQRMIQEIEYTAQYSGN